MSDTDLPLVPTIAWGVEWSYSGKGNRIPRHKQNEGGMASFHPETQFDNLGGKAFSRNHWRERWKFNLFQFLLLKPSMAYRQSAFRLENAQGL